MPDHYGGYRRHLSAQRYRHGADKVVHVLITRDQDDALGDDQVVEFVDVVVGSDVEDHEFPNLRNYWLETPKRRKKVVYLRRYGAGGDFHMLIVMAVMGLH